MLALLLTAGCSSSSPATTTGTTGTTGAAGPPGPTVDIKDIAFNPKTLTIRAGETVTWAFDDGVIPHNVTAAGWHSADRTSGSYRHTFTAAGTYPYRCTLHAAMLAQVVVTP